MNKIFVSNFGQLGLSINKNASYYPASGQKPTTNLYIKAADDWDCYSKPLSCKTYTHASEISIK